jgi:hypothetical protein
MAKHERTPPSPEVLDAAAARDRRTRLFEAADVAYRRAGAKTPSDLKAWENALADGLRN